MKQFQCIGYDAPDSWSGYHLPTLTIPVFEDMTNEMVADQLKAELDQVHEMFDDIWDDEHERMFNEYCDSLMANPELMAVEPNYEEELGEDDDAPMYLYFSFTNPTVVGGITFLDK